MELSADLVAWARLAGYSCSREADAILLFSSGGETCYYIRSGLDDTAWIVVTEADRGGQEKYVFSAANQEVLEKYFWNYFGFGIRMAARQPRLVFPTKREDIPSGYSIEIDSADRLLLTGPENNPIAQSRNSSTGTSLLVELAAVVGYSVEDLKDSYINPQGHPIFPRTVQQKD